MKSIKALAAKASLAALVATGAMAGSAQAITLENVTIGGENTATSPDGDSELTYTLASEVDFADDNATAELVFEVQPEKGALPEDNTLLTIKLSNAVFGADLDATNVVGVGACDADLTYSEGGEEGDTSVTYIVSQAGNCDVDAGDALEFTGDIVVDGTGTAAVTITLKTAAGNISVDGGSASSDIVDFASGYEVTIDADGTASTAQLPDFLTITDGVLGEVGITAATDEFGADVFVDFAGTASLAADVDTVDVTVAGDLTSFVDGTDVFITIDGVEFDEVDGDEAISEGLAASDLGEIEVTPDGEDEIVASDYEVTLDITLDDSVGLGLVADALGTVEGDLQSIDREGTQIVFPWVSSATLAATSGSTNTIRIANNGSDATGGVFVQVRSSSTTGYEDGLVKVANSIDAGEELLLTSASLEAALDNFARGDIEVTVEADADDLTARRLVVRADGIQELAPGTVEEDKN